MKRLELLLNDFGISDHQEKIRQFEWYMDAVLSWNQKVNLTAITDRQEFILKHFMDSVSCAESDEYRNAENVIDIGTGAGFPGLPLAILSPEKSFLLVDSLKKRIHVLQEMIGELGLSNVRLIHSRAEDLAGDKNYRAGYDICVSRAVSRMPVLLEYCLPFVKREGWLIAYKGPDIKKEMQASKRALNILGGRMDRIETSRVSEYGLDHTIVYIKKTENTPKQYPRKAGTPDRNPL